MALQRASLSALQPTSTALPMTLRSIRACIASAAASSGKRRQMRGLSLPCPASSTSVVMLAAAISGWASLSPPMRTPIASFPLASRRFVGLHAGAPPASAGSVAAPAPGGEVAGGEACGLVSAVGGGHKVESPGFRMTNWREAAEPMSGHHSIAGFEAGHAGTDGDDLTRAFAARDEGRFRPELVFAGQHQHVDILNAARLDTDLQLPRARRRRARHLTQCHD